MAPLQRLALAVALCACVCTSSVVAVTTFPEAAVRSKSVPYNPANPSGSPDVPFNHSYLAAPAGCVPQQVGRPEWRGGPGAGSATDDAVV